VLGGEKESEEVLW